MEYDIVVLLSTLTKGQTPLRYLVRSWSQIVSKPNSITTSWSQTGSNQLRTCLRPASNLLQTSFEPD